jgi:putative ABC transport system permease protein
MNTRLNLKNNSNINDTRKKIQEIFANDQKVQLRYPENSASGLRRVIENFSQFLSLVSISAMLIAGIGIANTLFYHF